MKRNLVVLSGFVLAAALAISWLSLASTRVQVLTVLPPSGNTAGATALRAQLELARVHDEQLISIVTTSLQVVVAIAIGLAAFNWFTNSQMYQRDLAAIERAATDKIESLKGGLKSELDDNFRAMAVRQEGIASKAAEKIIAPLREMASELKNDFYWSEYTRHEAEARALTQAEDGRGAFRAYLKALVSSSKDEHGYANYSELLDDIETTVVKFQYRPDASELGELETVYRSMTADHRPAIARVKAAIGNLKVVG